MKTRPWAKKPFIKIFVGAERRQRRRRRFTAHSLSPNFSIVVLSSSIEKKTNSKSVVDSATTGHFAYRQKKTGPRDMRPNCTSLRKRRYIKYAPTKVNPTRRRRSVGSFQNFAICDAVYYTEYERRFCWNCRETNSVGVLSIWKFSIERTQNVMKSRSNSKGD